MRSNGKQVAPDHSSLHTWGYERAWEWVRQNWQRARDSAWRHLVHLGFWEPGPQCKETWLTGSCLAWMGEKTQRSRSKSRVREVLSQNFCYSPRNCCCGPSVCFRNRTIKQAGALRRPWASGFLEILNECTISQSPGNPGVGPGNLHKHSIIRIRHHPEEAELVGILRIESHFHSLDLMA